MTICIALLYDKGQGCLLASDQMTTGHIPIGYEFENEEIEKIVKISENVYVLTSGDVLFAREVINIVTQRIITDNIHVVSGIAEAIRGAYQLVRRTRVVRNELEPRGMDLNIFLNNQQKLLPQLVLVIDQAFRTYNPMTEFIIAGKDKDSCHIYTIVNPGDLMCHDPIGFVAIGTGGPHAVYSMIASDYKKSMDKEKAKKVIEEAKKRSEVAPGVGKLTTIIEL